MDKGQSRTCPLYMRNLFLLLLVVCSLSCFADEPDNYITPIIVDNSKVEKISKCVDEYIKKQSKSYSKIAQDNLYSLIHNFDSIIANIYGTKVITTYVPYEEKIKALALTQCEAYYNMGTLK